ncbi:MAG: acyl-ACP thioesterase [Parvularculales bacterium]
MEELVRNSVQTWECDQMGHLNVQFYLTRADEGLAILGHKVGLGPGTLREAGLVLTAQEQHIRFHREQRPGAAYFLRGGIVSHRAEALSVYQEMVSTISGEVAATMAVEAVVAEVHTRSVRVMPDGVSGKVGGIMVTVPDHGKPRGITMTPPVPTPQWTEALASGMRPIWRGAVEHYMCAPDGVMTGQYLVGCISAGISNLLFQTSGRNREGEENIGGAVLEYRLLHHNRPQAGDIVGVCSGLKAVGGKTLTWIHWIFDLESETIATTAEAVAVTMDLRERRAVAMPDEMRTRMEDQIIPGIGV